MNKSEMQNLIKELVEKTTIPVKEVLILEDGSKTTCFSVEVSEPHFFLGRGGEALFALNHLARKIIEAKRDSDSDEDLNIMVDINGFQKKRIEGLRATAHMMAERARYFKSNIEVDPMPAFERRIIHEFLSEEIDLKTESTGEGMARRVVIKYIGGI
ncbi:MAG: R3H domain-containing nucleic acid-binding protein [Patescibacteria group bacterium]